MTAMLASALAATARPFAEARTLPAAVYTVAGGPRHRAGGPVRPDLALRGPGGRHPRPPATSSPGTSRAIRSSWCAAPTARCAAFFNVCRHRGSRLIDEACRPGPHPHPLPLPRLELPPGWRAGASCRAGDCGRARARARAGARATTVDPRRLHLRESGPGGRAAGPAAGRPAGPVPVPPARAPLRLAPHLRGGRPTGS